VTRNFLLSSVSALEEGFETSKLGDGGVGRVGVVGVLDWLLERPKRGSRKGSRLGGERLSLDGLLTVAGEMTGTC
jgi:hypothetical protein